MISEATEVYVSAASIWEAAIKIKLKKLEGNLEEIITAIYESGFVDLPINLKHVAGLNQLPDLHRDPFDRLLVSQAITEPLRLLTADPILEKYSELVDLI